MMKLPLHNIQGNMIDPSTFHNQLQQLLINLNQNSFLKRIESLNPEHRLKIIHQLQALDPQTLQTQRALVLNPPTPSSSFPKPYTNVIQSGDPNRIQQGIDLISSGKVGCIIVAGGQATRFGIDAPKGVFPISTLHQKSLFQIFFEKCAAASKLAGRALPLAIMTSPLNHTETKEFIESNHYFGLSNQQVDFFQQSMLPFLDENGNLFLESDSSIALGPDGNGSSLKSFVDSGIAKKWKNDGVETVVYILIDNPLADPFDAELVGTIATTHADVVIKCTDRRSPSERVGVIVEVNGKPKVIEYFELPPEAASWGDLYANISLFAFSLGFIEKIANQQMPLHKAFKPTKALDAETGSISAWKFEKFIFDVLDQASRVNVIRYPRACCFAPLKNKEGADSPNEVRAALLARDRQIYQQITGHTPPAEPIELSQAFYYPTPEFRARWNGKSASGYLE